MIRPCSLLTVDRFEVTNAIYRRRTPSRTFLEEEEIKKNRLSSLFFRPTGGRRFIMRHDVIPQCSVLLSSVHYIVVKFRVLFIYLSRSICSAEWKQRAHEETIGARSIMTERLRPRERLRKCRFLFCFVECVCVRTVVVVVVLSSKDNRDTGWTSTDRDLLYIGILLRFKLQLLPLCRTHNGPRAPPIFGVAVLGRA